MRLVFAGTPPVAVVALRALAASRHEVAAVVTRPDAGAGRGRRAVESAVARAAGELGIPVLKPIRPSDEPFKDQLRDLAPDLCPVVAYGALVPPQVLDIPTHSWVNLHFSLLPAWRGAAPVQAAILHGDDVTGATTFQLERGLDTGPCFGTVTESISGTDTAGDLLDRLATSGAGLLVATIDAIEAGTARARQQPVDGVSYAPKLTVDDVRVDWAAPALRINRLVRAASPAPGAWTTFRGERLKVGSVEVVAAGAALGSPAGSGTLAPDRVEPVDQPVDLAVGELRVAKNAVFVGTGSGPVRLVAVQPPGKRMMAGADWARGLRLTSGDVLL